MSGQFTRGPMDVGFSQTPHGLWTLDVSTGARVLLGWLHSHTDQFLQHVTVNMARRVFNTSSIAKWLQELADAGFVTITKGSSGTKDSFRLETEPWVALFNRRKHRAETGSVPPAEVPDRADVGAPEPARVVDHPDNNIYEDSLRSSSAVDTAPSKPAPMCRQERDAVFQATVIACGMVYDEMTKRQRSSCANAVAELINVGATPDEIHRRASIYPQKYHTVLTPNALANQWAALRVEGPPPTAARSSNVMDRVKARLAAEKEQQPDNVVSLRRVVGS